MDNKTIECSQKEHRSVNIIGIIFLVLFLTAAVAFVYWLSLTKMLPQSYLFMIAAVLLVIMVLTCFLTIPKRRHKIWLILGILLMVLMVAGMVLVVKYFDRAKEAFDNISETRTEISEVGIYVRAEDTVSSLQEMTGYNFGILQSLDRDTTDRVLEELTADLGTAPYVQEYAGLLDLVEGLFSGQTGAIVLNEGYIAILKETEGYTDIEQRIRKIAVKEIVTEMQQPDDSLNSGETAAHLTDTQAQQVYTIYISGIDSREGLVARSNSDVNIIVTLNTDTKQMLLVSTPRDFYVPLSVSGGALDKLTHAGVYGVQCSKDTLAMLYDIQIDHYFRVNFTGFVKIIDALGGITVKSQYEFDTNSGTHIVKGMNELNGAEALSLARERYAFASGDRQRGKNQMKVIKAVMDKASSMDMVLNFNTILQEVEGSFDTDFSYDEMAALVQKHLSVSGGWNVVTYSADGTGDRQVPWSLNKDVYVMRPDTATVEQAKELMRQVRDGVILPVQTEEPEM